MSKKELIHPPLNSVIESISGHYEYVNESILDTGEKKLLYYTGYSVTDRSCCGTGGCIFISIPGYVINLRHTHKTDGSCISTVEPIVDDKERTRIRHLLKGEVYHHQVIFIE